MGFSLPFLKNLQSRFMIFVASVVDSTKGPLLLLPCPTNLCFSSWINKENTFSTNGIGFINKIFGFRLSFSKFPILFPKRLGFSSSEFRSFINGFIWFYKHHHWWIASFLSPLCWESWCNISFTTIDWRWELSYVGTIYRESSQDQKQVLVDWWINFSNLNHGESSSLGSNLGMMQWYCGFLDHQLCFSQDCHKHGVS